MLHMLWEKDMTLLYPSDYLAYNTLLNIIIHWENPNYKPNAVPSGMAESKINSLIIRWWSYKVSGTLYMAGMDVNWYSHFGKLLGCIY